MKNVVAFSTKKTQPPKGELLKVRRGPTAGRLTDKAYGRTRSHLTPQEVESAITAAGKVGRHGLRDRAMLLVAFRHGLRVSELVALKWDQVDFTNACLHVTRLKRGTPATHPIEGDELRLLRRLRKDSGGAFVFSSERGGPMTRTGVNKLVSRAGELAGLPFRLTPHMLRHSTGFALANRDVPTRTIQAYLGHKAIGHTVRYTALSPSAFKNLWRR